jgi:Mg-chelatase subunit ChlD
MQWAHPAFLLLLAIVPWIWRVGRTARVPAGRAALICRCAIAMLLIFAVSGLRVRIRDGHVTVLFVLDRSDSLSARARASELARVNAMMAAMRSSDRAGFVAFGADAAIERGPSARADLTALATAVSPAATDIEAALKLARAALPRKGLRRIVLLSDGRETRGDAAREAAFAAADGVRIDVALPEAPPAARRAAVTRVTAPEDVRADEPFLIAVDAEGPPAGRAQLSVSRDDQAPATRDVVFAADGSAHATFSDHLRQTGVYAYRAVFRGVGDEGDDEAGAPAAGAMVSVLGPPTVLYVSSGGSLAGILTGAGFSVSRIAPTLVPRSARALALFDEIVLDDVPPESLDAAQTTAIAQYVEQSGGGLLLLGSARSLNAAGYPDGPLGRVLPVDLRPRQGRRAPAMALVLIFDKSGSMSDRADGVPKIEIAREAVRKVLDVMPPNDSLGVVAFDAVPSVVAVLGPMPDAKTLTDRLRAVEPGGSTQIAPAVRIALDWLRASPVEPARRHILLISDGRTTPADADRLRAELAAGGTELSVVAIGADADRAFLARLAQATGGRAYFPNDARELPLIVARDAARSAGGTVADEPFTLRSVPHPILTAIDRTALPRLGGYVVSAAKPGAETPLLSHLDDPILSTWRFGLGAVAVFTSDLGSTWSAPLHAWPQFGQLWSQTTRWLARAERATGLRMTIEDAGTGVRLIVEAEQPDGTFASGLDVRAVVRSPRGDTEHIAVEPIAPGRYEGMMAAAVAGPYVVAVTARDATGATGRNVVRGFYWSADRERRTGSAGVDTAVLERLARITGGSVLAPNESPFDNTRAAEYRDTWSWLAFAALWLFLIDVALGRGVGVRSITNYQITKLPN